LNIKDYIEFNEKVWRGREEASAGNDHDVVVSALGLAGETGEVVEHFKKYFRDGRKYFGETEVALELGDVFYYWIRLVQASGFSFEEVLQMNVEKLKVKRDKKKAS
jgi:NTP pyrophosphatase (non-canonical NTP hydrolase)